MAKRPTQSNTLFNYFSSPKGKITPKKIVQNGNAKASTSTPVNGKENIRKIADCDDSDEELQRPVKRSRAALIDSESDTERESPSKRQSSNEVGHPSKKQKADHEDYEDSESSWDGSDESSESDNSGDDVPDSPASPPKKAKSKAKTKSKVKSETKSGEVGTSSKKDLMTSFGYSKSDEKEEKSDEKEEKSEENEAKKPIIKVSKGVNIDSGWTHDTFDFIKPEKIRDAQKRRPSDPEYDPRTVFVSKDFLDSLSPAMRQWWDLKSQNFDTVLFFKVGKFYELYHMDAVTGVQELGLSYMKGDFAHSGFPEIAYGKMATMLIDKGLKVARVEQTETPEMMAERCKQMGKTTKFDKVVKREICQITTKATCVYGAQLAEARSELGTYLYAISAKVNNDTCRFGVCFIETSIGTFHVCEFEDDKHCSKLLSMFAEYQPGLILIERGANYGNFKTLLNSQLKDIPQEQLASKSQFYSAAATLEKFYSECYFKDKDGKFNWPSLFKEMADECAPKSEYELCLKSLGAINWFLKQSQLDIQVFSMGHFEKYDPIDLNSLPDRKHVQREYMVLDSASMENLSLLGGKGSLQGTLDFCKTAFGKRLLPLWISRPLCNVEKIQIRQDAVKELFENAQNLRACQNILKKLPDLERQVAKIHTYGNKFCSTNHPDGRAIFYEAKIYSKTKIKDLLRALQGFEASQEVAKIFQGCESRLLKKITQFVPVGNNINLTETLNFFKKAFNHDEAEKEGKITPKKGVDDDYDSIEDTIADINRELNEYLKDESKFFGCQVNYFGTDKKRFQLEVPENRAGKADADYRLEGSKKGSRPCKRFSTNMTRELLQRMLKAEAERSKIILDLNRRIFEKFSQKYDQWQQIIHCLTSLDVLCSLAEYASTYSGDICKPKVESFSTQPFISIENGKHPCVSNIENFVPNDTNLGTENDASLLVLTGPNMGGKSTLMRQVSIICIMAQMGSYIPAAQCSLSLIDRVFTRLGASDDIIKGQSTFFVELTEASAILKHASKQSLVIIDELGRGTSTHDGNAIATAYVRKLVEDIRCRALFSTHYHTLVDQFVNTEGVQLGHMACMVENDDDPTEESVTLLYKLAEGRCPKSFGFNAAKLAGLPSALVVRAREVAKEMEAVDKGRHIFSKVFGKGILNIGEVRKMIAGLEL